MTTTQEALDEAALMAKRAHKAAWQIVKGAGDNEVLAGQGAEVMTAAWHSIKAAIRAGATEPEGMRPKSAPAPGLVRPELLTSPANRRLLDALRVAAEAAAEVDRERGHDPEDGFAAVMEHYVAQIGSEVVPPRGTMGE